MLYLNKPQTHYNGQTAEIKHISIESTGQLIFWIQLPSFLPKDNVLAKTLDEIDLNFDHLWNNYNDSSLTTVNFKLGCLKTAKKCAWPKIYLIKSKVDSKVYRAVCVDEENLGGGSIYGSTCAPISETSKVQVGTFFLIDQGRYECHSNQDQTVFSLEDVLKLGSEKSNQKRVCSLPKNEIEVIYNLPPLIIACKINGLELENHLLNEKSLDALKSAQKFLEINNVQSIEDIILPGTFSFKLPGMIIENNEIDRKSVV